MNLQLTKGSRERYFALLILVIMGAFIIRLFYLQIIQHSYYVAQASNEQVRQLTIPAKRGLIYAMDDGTPTPMVLNQTVYTVFADPSEVKDASKVVSMVNEVAGGNAVSNMSDLLSNKKSRYAVLAHGVTRQQAASMKDKNLSGVGFTKGTERVYPEDALAGQVLGFVNAAGQGQYGAEGYFNEDLSGHDGMLKTVTDVRDVPLTVGKDNIDIPAKNGENVALTIDRNVQAAAKKALMSDIKSRHIKKASVLVMNPENGHVLAMASYPSYSPAKYGQVKSAAVYQNPTISSPYEPGSDVKTLTAATAIDQGVMTPTKTYYNTDAIRVEDRTITNAVLGQTGNITIQTAMDFSLNTGFVTVAQWLGDVNDPPGHATINAKARRIMYEYFHDRFHLAEPTGIQLAGENPGIIIAPNTPNGGAVRYSNMAFGQGLDATMLQVASAFGSAINGGTYYHPTVYAGAVDDNGVLSPAKDKAPESGVVKPHTSNVLRKMVHDARDKFYGGTDTPGYYIGGKTGTSQAIVDGVYSDTQTIGTYLGFGGEKGKKPAYVIMVRVSGKDQHLEGNADAMPVFNDLSNWMLRYLKLQPKG